MFRFCYILISIGRDFYFLIFDLEELKFSEVFRKFGGISIQEKLTDF
jgi:hypothetical protein